MARTHEGNKGRRLVAVDVRLKHAEAVRLRTQGLTYDEIALALGYSNRSAARKAVVGTLQAVEYEAVAELRRLEAMRLDQLQAAHWSSAVEGDQRSTRTVLDIMGRRARLFGLDGNGQQILSAQDLGSLGTLLAHGRDLHEKAEQREQREPSADTEESEG